MNIRRTTIPAGVWSYTARQPLCVNNRQTELAVGLGDRIQGLGRRSKMLRNCSCEGAAPQPMVVLYQVMCFTNTCTFSTPRMSDFVAGATSIVLILLTSCHHIFSLRNIALVRASFFHCTCGPYKTDKYVEFATTCLGIDYNIAVDNSYRLVSMS